MATPAPPYVYPRQKPTDDSVDDDGEILRRIPDGDGMHTYSFFSPEELEDGDLWVPACNAFFGDWAKGEDLCDDSTAQCMYVDRHWLKAPGES